MFIVCVVAARFHHICICGLACTKAEVLPIRFLRAANECFYVT